MMTALKQEKQVAHHEGHRDRLRQRFISAGPESVADYELLEMLLFSAIPRKDVVDDHAVTEALDRREHRFDQGLVEEMRPEAEIQ